MSKLYKFLQLPLEDRKILIEAILLLAAIRLGLWLLPFHRLRRFLIGIAQLGYRSPKGHQISINRVVWILAAARRYIPGVRCLAQAMAAQILLTRCGYLTYLRVGIARGTKGQLEAHAWAEIQGEIVVGGLNNISLYTPIPLSLVK
jgi:hypothetical protein